MSLEQSVLDFILYEIIINTGGKTQTSKQLKFELKIYCFTLNLQINFILVYKLILFL